MRIQRSWRRELPLPRGERVGVRGLGRFKQTPPSSLETKKLAELRKLRARRAKAVGRMSVVAVADRHGAEQHLFGRHGDEFADDAVHAGPGFLRAGIEAVAAGEERQGVDIAAEIGPLAGAELAVDGDEQRDRRVEEFEIALVLRKPP